MLFMVQLLSAKSNLVEICSKGVIYGAWMIKGELLLDGFKGCKSLGAFTMVLVGNSDAVVVRIDCVIESVVARSELRPVEPALSRVCSATASCRQAHGGDQRAAPVLAAQIRPAVPASLPHSTVSLAAAGVVPSYSVSPASLPSGVAASLLYVFHLKNERGAVFLMEDTKICGSMG
ncbi:hypothetical protein Droror1_Dr00024810 [Drosera rotundifolia]